MASFCHGFTCSQQKKKKKKKRKRGKSCNSTNQFTEQSAGDSDCLLELTKYRKEPRNSVFFFLNVGFRKGVEQELSHYLPKQNKQISGRVLSWENRIILSFHVSFSEHTFSEHTTTTDNTTISLTTQNPVSLPGVNEVCLILTVRLEVQESGCRRASPPPDVVLLLLTSA